MKHVFIVNPISGKGNASRLVFGSLSSLPREIESEIYITKSKGDAERFIHEYCNQNPEPVRFYACGGDGTVHEVVNGVVPHPQASFTVYPCGSGNDFVKCFGERELFLDIPSLVSGTEIPIDVMKVNDRFCINICHFGFDSYVAAKMNEVRSKKLIGGDNAYTTGVALGLLNAMKSRAVISADGEVMCSGDFLLCTAANGRYVGGKYKCAPEALVNDGVIDLCVVSPVSRLTFIKLVKYYADGSHLTDPRFKNFLKYKRCSHIEINAQPGFSISLDGEMYKMQNAMVDIIHNGIRLALPKNAAVSAPAL